MWFKIAKLRVPGGSAEQVVMESDESGGSGGCGIVSITRTSGTGEPGTTDIYTILYTDGTSDTLEVYNGKDGEDGHTPVKGEDYWTDADKTEIAEAAAKLVDVDVDDTLSVSGAAADAAVVGDELAAQEKKIDDLKAQGVQQTPLYAESEDWLNTNGDTTKLYVLPDGYIYAYATVTETAEGYTNLATTLHEGYRYNSSGVLTATDGACACEDIIPFSEGTVVRIRGLGSLNTYNLTGYQSAEGETVQAAFKPSTTAAADYLTYSYDSETDTATLTSLGNQYTPYFRITGILSGSVDDVIITVNAEIKEETVTTQKWASTGHAFVPADYEDRIVTLEESVADLKDEVESIGGTGTAETVTIPSYWEDMVTAKTEAVKTLQTAGGKDCVCFAWASDTHIPDNDSGRTNNIGRVMAAMLDNCEIPFAVLSGDIGTRASYPTEAEFVATHAEIPQHLAPLWGTDRLLMALGNHDGCYGDSTGYYKKQFTPERMWQMYLRGQSLDFRRVFSDDGLYFYVDNIAQKTRFIVLNSHYGGEYAEDENGWAVNNRFSTSCYGQDQLDWLADVALDMPEGYGAIITAHAPPNITYTVDKEQFIGIVNAYCNKTTYSGSFAGVDGWTSNNVSVDFTDAKGEIIAMFAGHVHADYVDTTTLACPLITITAAGASSNDDEQVYTRTFGTDQETSFDVVTINRATRTISCTRVGAGSDREVVF